MLCQKFSDLCYIFSIDLHVSTSNLMVLREILEKFPDVYFEFFWNLKIRPSGIFPEFHESKHVIPGNLMVKIEIRLTFLLTLILSNRRSKFKSFKFERGKLQNLSGKLQKLSGKLQICGKLQINVSKNVNRISINHKIRLVKL